MRVLALKSFWAFELYPEVLAIHLKLWISTISTIQLINNLLAVHQITQVIKSQKQERTWWRKQWCANYSPSFRWQKQSIIFLWAGCILYWCKTFVESLTINEINLCMIQRREAMKCNLCLLGSGQINNILQWECQVQEELPMELVRLFTLSFGGKELHLESGLPCTDIVQMSHPSCLLKIISFARTKCW